MIRSVFLLLAVLAAGCAAPRTSATFEHAAVAADHFIASEAGAEMLRKGGNAVDAAVATSFTLSVVRPESCGIGGGGFMVVHLSEAGVDRLTRLGRTIASPDIALNYRETCPAAVGPDYYENLSDPSASTHGGTAVGIPGTVAGLLHALDRYGTLDRATVLAPAIRAAEQGFTADAHYAESVKSLTEKFQKHPDWKRRFAFVWERYLHSGSARAGDRIRIPEQAAALRLIAECGPAGFYLGPVADAMLEAIHKDGGEMNEDDLRSFAVREGQPLKFDFWDWHALTMPPPSSGGVAMAEAMGIFESLTRKQVDGALAACTADLERPPIATGLEEAIDRMVQAIQIVDAARYGPEIGHALVEALKHAFADRAEWLGDPAFAVVPTQTLLSKDYIAARAATFNPDHTLPPESYGTREPSGTATAPQDDHGTSHFSIVDADGSAVACTETINLEFGSALAVPAFGFILNDQMDDFTTRRGKPNAFGLTQSYRNLPARGKRPLSSMTPTIVIDAHGQVAAVAGASGGPRIITGTMQALLNALIWGDSAAGALMAPRVHHQWQPDVVRVEMGLAPDVASSCGEYHFADGLISRGHTLERTDKVGNVQLIKRSDRGWEAACDPRKGGRPAGY